MARKGKTRKSVPFSMFFPLICSASSSAPKGIKCPVTGEVSGAFPTHRGRGVCFLEWPDTLWAILLGSGLASGTVPAGLPLRVSRGSPCLELQGQLCSSQLYKHNSHLRQGNARCVCREPKQHGLELPRPTHTHSSNPHCSRVSSGWKSENAEGRLKLYSESQLHRQLVPHVQVCIGWGRLQLCICDSLFFFLNSAFCKCL